MTDSTTPVSSPKPSAKPSTPPRTSSRGSASAERRSARLSASFLRTPEQSGRDQVPFSPSLKRTNSGNVKSPEYLSSHHNVSSPYTASSLLKTPRHSGYDSDDNKDSQQHRKLQKTPQFFSSAKKLFQNDDSSNTEIATSTSPTAPKDDISGISLQLKNRLSSALGKIQRDDSQTSKFTFTELTFDSSASPTKKSKSHDVPATPWTPSSSVQKANLNLQTLQQSPIGASSPGPSSAAYLFSNYNQNNPLKQSPRFSSEAERNISHEISVADEESSAHNALLAALSRQRRKSRSSVSSPKKRSSILTEQNPTVPPNSSTSGPKLSASFNMSPSQSSKINLPSLNVALKPEEKTNNPKLNNEQDAVLSLMSLSSPQSIKFPRSRTHSRNHSLNDLSPLSPGNEPSQSLLASPINSQTSHLLSSQHPVLPPISGLINPNKKRLSKALPNTPGKTAADNDTSTDNDETDVDDATDEDI